MNFIPDGIISKFLDLIGVECTSITSQYIAFVTCGSLFALLSIALMVLLFRFLVFIRKG